VSDDPFDDFEDDPFADGDDADRQDPFVDADDADEADRGDPFDDIEADIPEEATDEASLFEESETGDSGDQTVPEDPFSEPETSAGGAEAPFAEPGDAPGEGEDPFEGFETPDGDPFGDLDSGSSDLDDSVWEDLSAEQGTEPLSEQQAGKRVSEVSKHRFCEQCPHFSGPPEISCSHEGTEILEFLDYETVRLADCPVVAEREALENMQ
jgi:hypothetical protein